MDFSVTDYLVTGEKFRLVKNKTHGYLETHPQPDPISLSKYYESEEYISHTDSKKGLMSFLYQRVKKYSLQKKVKLITKLNGGVGSLLDFGAGTGDFLKLASHKKWIVDGVEPNAKARSLAASKEIELREKLSHLKDEKYDVVTLWHVLEHLPNLEEAISEIGAKVEKGGALVIAVPNYKSYDAQYYKQFWAAYDVPRHLWHFSRDAMQQLFSSEFELEEIKPMIFDSYYVSLLSEKYKSGSKFSFNALWRGWRSNVKAKRSKEYSSLIYCFRKLN